MKKYLRNILRNIKFLFNFSIKDSLYDLQLKMKDEIIEDIVYEYEEDKQILKNIDILDEYQFVEILKTNPKSFCRYGDGEINLMLGYDQPFQKYNLELVNKLYAILREKHSDMYVGLNRAYFHTPLKCSQENYSYYRIHATKFRRFFIRECHSDNIYFDAGFATAYFRFDDEYDYEKHYENMKSLFENKKIVLLSGEGVFEKLDHNVFERAKSFRIIHGPSKHAYDKYDEIIKEINEKVSKDEIICFILGMAGKAMSYDLTKQGYMVWDVGHMAKDYDAYMKGIEKNHKNTREFYAPD